MNKTILMGRMGGDPELRFMQNGNAVANFTLATSERWKDKDGSPQESTEWHRVVVFGKLAEIVGQHAKKGAQVLITGKTKTRSYDKDGQKVYTTEVILDQRGEFEFVGAKPDGSGNQEQHKQESRKQAASRPQASHDQDYNDDIPF